MTTRHIPCIRALLPPCFLRSLAARLLAAVLSLLPAALGIRAAASECRMEPETPMSGEPATILYDPSGGPLADAEGIQVRLAFNDWSGRIGRYVPETGVADLTMSRETPDGPFTLRFTVPETASNLNMAFHDTSADPAWDNNNRADWHFPVTPAPPPEPIPDPRDLPPGASRARVMMQGFYWDCPDGVWYERMASKAPELRNMMGGHGIDRIWFPPPSKGQYTRGMGYDPYDYYDLGAYDQKGTLRTRFGTQDELRRAIAAFRANGIACMADIVLNHRSGGVAEANPNLGGAKTWTDFSGVASGKCTWRFGQFHPSAVESFDDGAFAGFADVCTATGNEPGTARHDLLEWGRWLQDPANAGFDGGWRFDYVKGYRPSFMAEFRAATGNAFGMQECWDTRIATLDAYLAYSGETAVLDFPGQLAMRLVFSPPDGNDPAPISDLMDPGKVYAAHRPGKAVTFVANHDTDKGEPYNRIVRNKMLAYAFILTYQGYPCIFWQDYFESGMAGLGGQPGNGIRPLVWVRGALAGGIPTVEPLKADDSNLLVYGTTAGIAEAPGYIAAINSHPSEAGRATVITGNPALRGKPLACYAWYSYVDGCNARPTTAACAADGTVTLGVPPRGYAVYGPAGVPGWGE